MIVTGPDWPSTRALREALALVESPLEVRWGSGGVDGLNQLVRFHQAQVLGPRYTNSLEVAKKWVRQGEKVFGRRLHHTQGSDIIGSGFRAGSTSQVKPIRFRTRKGNMVTRTRLVKGRTERWNREWLKRDFWVIVLPSVAEYRQHVWDGRAIRLGKKVKAGESWRKQPVRARNNGWHIDYGAFPRTDEFVERIRELAKRAVSALGYIGGAVDILEGTDGQLYVLEVNSAPALTDTNTLSAYVQAIQRWSKREMKKTQG